MLNCYTTGNSAKELHIKKYTVLKTAENKKTMPQKKLNHRKNSKQPVTSNENNPEKFPKTDIRAEKKIPVVGSHLKALYDTLQAAGLLI